jgi:hypothetical protein
VIVAGTSTGHVVVFNWWVSLSVCLIEFVSLSLSCSLASLRLRLDALVAAAVDIASFQTLAGRSCAVRFASPWSADAHRVPSFSACSNGELLSRTAVSEDEIGKGLLPSIRVPCFKQSLKLQTSSSFVVCVPPGSVPASDIAFSFSRHAQTCCSAATSTGYWLATVHRSAWRR